MKVKYKFLLIYILLLVIQVIFTVKSNAVVNMTLDELKAKFPQDKYWNHVCNGYSGGYCTGTCNNPDGYTDRPCEAHNRVPTAGQIDCNQFYGNIQCKGFAFYVAHLVYGGYCASDWNVTYDINNLKPGDVLVYEGDETDPVNNENGHTVFVIDVDGDSIYCGEANVDGQNCKISWGRVLSKASIYNVHNVFVIYQAPEDFKKAFTLKANIVPYKPSTLTWSPVEGASFYRIKGRIEGVDCDFENPDFRLWKWADYWETTETSYIRTLAAGDYAIYIEAYDTNSNIIETSNEIQISIENVEIQFKDLNFEEYINGYVWNDNHLFAYNSDFIQKGGKFKFNDLPRNLAISYSDGNSHQPPEGFDCSIYFLNEDGSKNYEIEKYEKISNDHYSNRII